MNRQVCFISSRKIFVSSAFFSSLGSIAALLLILIISACNPQTASKQTVPAGSSAAYQSQTTHQSTGPERQKQTQTYGNQNQVLQAQSARANKLEVLFSARVAKLLPDDTEGLPHQRFLLILDNGSTLLVAHDIKFAPKVPTQPGDLVTVKGEYIWNERGGVVHWTHHSNTARHEGGFIDFAGNRYQ